MLVWHNSSPDFVGPAVARGVALPASVRPKIQHHAPTQRGGVSLHAPASKRPSSVAWFRFALGLVHPLCVLSETPLIFSQVKPSVPPRVERLPTSQTVPCPNPPALPLHSEHRRKA